IWIIIKHDIHHPIQNVIIYAFNIKLSVSIFFEALRRRAGGECARCFGSSPAYLLRPDRVKRG
ncbi:MAG: hypothetical protein KKD47_01940, partial [Proteobacteria bacterium]|nr:hypothetical protein [Pseudomonadota bacterium]